MKPYTEIIHKMYWEDGLNFNQISKILGVSSQAGIYRHMKKYDSVKTREQQLQELKEKNKNRTFTEEQKKRISEGIKRSYQSDELRKRRSEDNKRIWKNMSEEDKKRRYSKGLNKMHKKKRKILLVLEISKTKDGAKIEIRR